MARRILMFIFFLACAKPPEEKPIPPPPQCVVPPKAQLDDAVFVPKQQLIMELRGDDFEDALGSACPLEAYVKTPKPGEQPVLRFRCIKSAP